MMCKVDHLPQIYSAIPWHNSIMHFFSRELRTWVIERSTCFLFWVQYNADAHNTHAHSPFWTHVHKPYPYEHLRGNIAYHLTHNAGKFWNKFRKMWAPVPSRGLTRVGRFHHKGPNQLIYDQFASTGFHLYYSSKYNLYWYRVNDE